MGKTAERLDELQATLDAWTHDLGLRAKALAARLAKHRKKLDASGRRQGGYRPLLLTVVTKGVSLEIRWQRADKKGPHGQVPRMGYWLTPVRKVAQREGGGYSHEALATLATDGERDLVLELEREAQALRTEHADNMTIRRGVTTVRLRERARAKEGKDA